MCWGTFSEMSDSHPREDRSLVGSSRLQKVVATYNSRTYQTKSFLSTWSAERNDHLWKAKTHLFLDRRGENMKALPKNGKKYQKYCVPFGTTLNVAVVRTYPISYESPPLSKRVRNSIFTSICGADYVQKSPNSAVQKFSREHVQSSWQCCAEGDREKIMRYMPAPWNIPKSYYPWS